MGGGEVGGWVGRTAEHDEEDDTGRPAVGLGAIILYVFWKERGGGGWVGGWVGG